MTTLIENFESGTLDAGISDVDTVVTSAGFANLQAVAAPDTLKLVFDPEGTAGSPEIVTVTTHTASSTSVTVTRGVEGTLARSHAISQKWVHAATAADWTQALGGAVPVGSILPYAGTSSPDVTTWLLCSGQAVSRTTYATLFSVISTTFGVGDGSTTFNVPDLRGRVPFGLDNMGGTPANRVTDAAADSVGGAIGSATHTLSSAELPSHSHSFSGFGSGSTGSGSAHSHSVNSHSHSITHDHGSFTTSSGGGHTHGLLSSSTSAGTGGFNKTNTASGSAFSSSTGNHTHSINVPNFSGQSGLTSPSTNSESSHTHSFSVSVSGSTGLSGSSSGHNIVQPSMAMGYIIRAA